MEPMNLDNQRPDQRHDMFFGRLKSVVSLIDLAEFKKMELTHRQKNGEYLSNLHFDDQLDASETANQLQDASPPGDVVALIPVAAHQESPNVYRSLGQYAHQRSSEPFSVLLLLNAPEDAPSSNIAKTIDEIERAKADFPQLDVRYSEIVESDPIGALRRRLWNAALLLAYREGDPEGPYQETIGLNHDIDTHKIAQNYIENIRSYYRTMQGRFERSGYASATLLPASTVMKHANSPDHPNASSVVFWNDYSLRQAGNADAYEASIAIPFRHYSKRGGFDASATTYETNKFLTGLLPGKVGGTSIETSPRRFIDRLREGGLDTVWTDDSFGMSDNCRTDSNMADISVERKDAIIGNSIENAIDLITLGTVLRFERLMRRPEFSYLRDMTNILKLHDAVEQTLLAKKRQAITVLNRFVHSPVNANKLHDEFDVEEATGPLTTQIAEGATFRF